MNPFLPSLLLALAPPLLMAIAMLACLPGQRLPANRWPVFIALSCLALPFALASSLGGVRLETRWLSASTGSQALSALVQFLSIVIAAFSSRYLAGETGQRRYAAALGGVICAVHLLLLANHWLLLIAAWACIGIALQHLLCFYAERPFALLAARKKYIADRLADLLLISAAAIAWAQTGSGSFPDLWQHIAQHGMSPALQLSALCLTAAVILRTALLPAHGWLIQVMEAPTPVSALLHAGVVNLGGFVLIRFAPMLEQAPLARYMLLAFGLAAAVLGGMVVLSRISIKVQLAWSTVAQMGFMVMECALGLYGFAMLHLIGHSLYKACAFLSASGVVRETRVAHMRGEYLPSRTSLIVAPLLSTLTVVLTHAMVRGSAWPWWWSLLLGVTWAPCFWLRDKQRFSTHALRQILAAVLMTAGLTLIASLAHLLPLAPADAPVQSLGLIALFGMGLLYLCIAGLQHHPHAFETWRRWSYAGFYLDEYYTRLALKLGAGSWIPARAQQSSVRWSTTSAPQ